ncbi:hypothetical protein SAZ11_60810 [Streptomyces sp. FXJ1.4098]|nr:hypothetical protein [Streptomyces sp. FXJ1.4098]
MLSAREAAGESRTFPCDFRAVRASWGRSSRAAVRSVSTASAIRPKDAMVVCVAAGAESSAVGAASAAWAADRGSSVADSTVAATVE